VIGFQVGLRKSAQSWHDLLTDIKGRGLSVPPEIAVGPARAICYANALPGNGRCHGVLERAGQGVSTHKAPTVLPSRRCTHRLPCDRCANPIESVFATVRHRTVRTKGALSQKTTKLMVFTLIQAASKKWLRLKGKNQLPKVIEGIKFNDGAEVTDDTENRAA
jgi:putative transposase